MRIKSSEAARGTSELFDRKQFPGCAQFLWINLCATLQQTRNLAVHNGFLISLAFWARDFRVSKQRVKRFSPGSSPESPV
jgi:uridine phosphorylase